ncbi:uncharacterized protein LOC142803775 isoform X2 [Rhipicephalus microplus]|uniref:uncharacterized protein LOC142803775 isoform X2 n=1 Tax=Rhipicephalus microplus TaxID=6941 RepID=UPI003F6B1E4D
MEAEKMICYWTTCGKPLPAEPGLRHKFVRCSECGHLSCLHCKAMHEGKSCAAFQAERRPAARSPTPSPLGARRKSGDTPSPSKVGGSSEGDMSPSRVSPQATLATYFDAMTLLTPCRLSWADDSARTSSAGSSRSPNVAAQSTSPSKSVVADRVTRSGDRGTSRQMRTAICRTEDCGFEKQVDAGDTELYCYKCRKTTCLVCNASHGLITCEEYRRQLDDQEEEIQVWCAGKDCLYTVYVGASTQQLRCTLCDRITCLKCQAVHEFQTCDAYARDRRRSNVPQPEEERTTGGGGETYAKEESTVEGSRADENESGDMPPPCATSVREPMGREASRQKEVLVQQAANIPRPCETASEHPQPGTRQNVTVAAPRVTASERPSPRARHTEGVAAPPLDAVVVECCACAVESNIEEIIDVTECGHLLCKECVHATAVGSLTYIVHCPVATETGVSCDAYIQESALKSVMTEEECAIRNELVNSPIIRCPMEGCSGKFSVRPGTRRLNCPKCQIEYCVSCSSNHSGVTCEQFIRGVADDAQGSDVADYQTPTSSSTTSVNDQQGASRSVLGGPHAALDQSPASFAVECSQCLAETPFGEIIDLLWCGHFLCRECVQRTAVNTVAHFVHCPVVQEGGSQCGSYIQESALKSPEKRIGRQTTLDPRETWATFLRHSERTQTARPKKKVDPSFLRMEGPQGPPGPRGPRGPPGANITREDMFREFKGLLREAAERRAQVMAEMQCHNTTNCTLPLSGGMNGSDSLLPWLPPLVEIDRASMMPRAQSGFFWELSDEVRARKGKELRLHPFHRPFAEGSFERGSGLNATRGMFRAPLSGLYLFFATAFATRPTSARALRKQLETSANDASLLVCLNARCQKNLSLRTTSEFSDGEYTMSLAVNGPLMLRAGQVVSLWFHNRTPYQITIHEGSQFSGFLVGL